MKKIIENISLPSNYVPTFLRINGKYYEAPEGLLENSPVLLIAPPGSGKTTVLSLLAKQIFKQKAEKVIFIECRHIIEEVTSDFNGFVGRLVENYDQEELSLTLIFDGLDEIHPEYRKNFISNLRNWIELNSSVRFVLSSRPTTIVEINNANLAEIDRDSDAYIKLYVNEAFSDPSYSKRLLEIIQSNEAIRSLAASPFFLNLLVSVFSYNLSLPEKLSDLYSVWTDIVSRNWDKSRGIKRNVDILSLADTRLAMSQLALGMLRDSKVFFRYEDWEKIVASISDCKSNVARNTLNVSVIGTGIVLERGINTFSFIHLSLHEYYAALCLLDYDAKNAYSLIEESSFLGLEKFYVEMTPYPGRLAGFLLDKGDIEGARRVINLNPNVSLDDKRRLISLVAEKLGVGAVTFEVEDEKVSSEVESMKSELRIQWDKCISADTSNEKGASLERFATSLFGGVFEIVDVNRNTPFGEVDIICEVKQAAFWQRWPGDCFVECKNQKEKTGVDVANEFAGKCSTIRMKLVFLVSMQALTKPSKERLARSWGEVGTPDMAWLDGSDIEKWLDDETDAETLLKRAVRRSGYGITL